MNVLARLFLRLEPQFAAHVAKRRFRVRQDGWVRHDGGTCPLPAGVRLLVWKRGVEMPVEGQSDQIPDAWWGQERGKWDVLWFRPIAPWSVAPPPVFRDLAA